MSAFSGIFKRAGAGAPRSEPVQRSAVAEIPSAYADFVGAANFECAPPMVLHNLCFPGTVEVLSDPAIPARLLGLVHESLAWELREPVPAGTTVEANSLVTRVVRGRGLTIEVTSAVVSNHGVHYIEKAVYFSRKLLQGTEFVREHPSVPTDWQAPAVPDLRAEFGVNDAGSLELGQLRPRARHTLTADAGRQWARISGDANPIHLSAIAARPFGFKSAIAHGIAIEAWVHHELGIDGANPASGATRFRAPTRIPNEIELVELEPHAYAVVESRTGRDLVHVRTRTNDLGTQTPSTEAPIETRIDSTGGSPVTTPIVIPRFQGRISSTELGRAVFSAAAEGEKDVLAAISAARNWRKQYREPVRQVSIVDDPARGSEVAQRGLDYIANNVTLADGIPLGQIAPTSGVPLGLRIVGRHMPRRELAIPYGGKRLEGEELDRQLTSWIAGGILTATAGDRIRQVARNPQWLNLSGATFGVIGAGAELAPTSFLLDYGAKVAGVIRPGSARLPSLTEVARNSAGTLDLSPAQASDVVGQTAAVAGWLIDRRPDVVVETLYAPGVDFLLLEMGADVIMAALAENTDAMPAWYGTPTDAYPIGERRERAGGVAYRPGKSAKLWRSRGSEAIADGVYNGIVDFQGPNYILAKRIGRWRATVLAAAGRPVSFNIAPMARTESVLISKTLIATYRGLDKLGLEPLDADTAAALMGTLLVWDYRNQREPGANFLTEAAIPSGLWSQDAAAQDVMKRAVLLGSGAFLR